MCGRFAHGAVLIRALPPTEGRGSWDAVPPSRARSRGLSSPAPIIIIGDALYSCDARGLVGVRALAEDEAAGCTCRAAEATALAVLGDTVDGAGDKGCDASSAGVGT